MHCFRCKSLMNETGRQTAGHSEVTWYQCPVCSMERLHAQPMSELRPEPVAANEVGLRRVYGGR